MKTYSAKAETVERDWFLIDADGKLRQEWRGVKVKGHVEEVLDADRLHIEVVLLDEAPVRGHRLTLLLQELRDAPQILFARLQLGVGRFNRPSFAAKYIQLPGCIKTCGVELSLLAAARFLAAAARPGRGPGSPGTGSQPPRSGCRTGRPSQPGTDSLRSGARG